MAKTIMRVAGANGIVELMDDRVVIHRKGLLNAFKYGFNSRREIPLSSITSLNFRDANFFKMGEIDFDFAGRSQIDRQQNNVTFTSKNQAQFLALKDKIFELMQRSRK